MRYMIKVAGYMPIAIANDSNGLAFPMGCQGLLACMLGVSVMYCSQAQYTQPYNTLPYVAICELFYSLLTIKARYASSVLVA